MSAGAPRNRQASLALPLTVLAVVFVLRAVTNRSASSIQLDDSDERRYRRVAEERRLNPRILVRRCRLSRMGGGGAQYLPSRFR
jgi:hypothetical protein